MDEELDCLELGFRILMGLVILLLALCTFPIWGPIYGIGWLAKRWGYQNLKWWNDSDP